MLHSFALTTASVLHSLFSYVIAVRLTAYSLVHTHRNNGAIHCFASQARQALPAMPAKLAYLPRILVLLASLSLVANVHAVVNSVTITEGAAIRAARICVRSCVDSLTFGIGCYGAEGDSCLCAENLRPDGSRYLSSCLDRSTCDNPSDYGVATAVYDSYCKFTGPATVTATASPAGAESSNAGNGPVTVTITSSQPTVTVRSTASSFTSPAGTGKLLVAAALTAVACLVPMVLPRR